MEQLGDKTVDGFGLQRFAKTRCSPSLILLPQATCLVFALQKPIIRAVVRASPTGMPHHPSGAPLAART